MQHTCNMRGVCSRTVTFDLDNENIVRNISFAGGCSGNLQGVAALADGRPAADVIRILRGIHCGFKATSCPDQFARAVEQAVKEK